MPQKCRRVSERRPGCSCSRTNSFARVYSALEPRRLRSWIAYLLRRQRAMRFKGIGSRRAIVTGSGRATGRRRRDKASRWVEDNDWSRAGGVLGCNVLEHVRHRGERQSPLARERRVASRALVTEYTHDEPAAGAPPECGRYQQGHESSGTEEDRLTIVVLTLVQALSQRLGQRRRFLRRRRFRPRRLEPPTTSVDTRDCGRRERHRALRTFLNKRVSVECGRPLRWRRSRTVWCRRPWRPWGRGRHLLLLQLRRRECTWRMLLGERACVGGSLLELLRLRDRRRPGRG